MFYLSYYEITVAIALANKVLPVPGGPKSNTPFHGYLIPLKYSGIRSGKNIAYLSISFVLVKDAIS